MTIFEFFKNFYESYIFVDDLLDLQTLNLITAITTLMFFIAVFKGIWSIFSRSRKKWKNLFIQYHYYQ